MLFTEGKDRKYERMMQEKPGFQRDRRRMVFQTPGSGIVPIAFTTMKR